MFFGRLLFLVGLASSALAAMPRGAFASDKPITIGVTYNTDTDKYEVADKFDPVLVDAYGYYYKNYNNSGWNYLDVIMQEEVDSVSDHLQYSKSFGYLEGYVTCNEIKAFYPNFYSAVFGTDKVGKGTLDFVKDNYDWLQQMADKNADTDNYWYTIKATLQQLQGLYEGYVAGCGGNGVQSSVSKKGNPYATLDEPSFEHFLLLNAWGDLYEITIKYKEAGASMRLKGNRQVSGGKRTLVDRCSAIVKLLADKSDVIYGHSTWDSYESLGPRIFKHYNFALMRSGFAESHYDVRFSSSPALLSSIDDFFTATGYARLGVIETTNELYNVTMAELVVPQTVLSWQRAVVSNQLAMNGADWAQVFSKYHSGTYTNQWLVVDLRLFSPGQNPQPGFLTVLEELPGLIVSADQTQTLINEGYWAGYNVPYYDQIFVESGYAKLCDKDKDNCHDTAPRAKIFKDNQAQITSVEGGEWILMYNHWQQDKASEDDSCNTIACRGDLEKKKSQRGGYGALDAKVTSWSESNRPPGVPPVLHARIGPTHDDQPVFCWSQLSDESDYVHNGQPDCFDFQWVTLPPQ